MRFQLVYNPAAGRGRARRHIAEARDYLRGRGVDVDCVESSSPADLTRRAADGFRRGYDRVVVCGGDGSLNLAVRELDFTAGVLGIIPLGSGDDFARVLGIPRNVRGACEALLSGNTRDVDVALANGTRYLGVAGLGFDSEVTRYANDHVTWLRGSAVYLYALLRVLPRFTPHRVTIDDARSEEIMFAVVGNSRQYGGGIRIVPDAKIDDGQLDLCLVRKTTRAQLLKTLPSAYSGAHVKSRFVETARAASFRFASERPMEVYADGELITQTPVTFAIAPGKLRVAVP